MLYPVTQKRRLVASPPCPVREPVMYKSLTHGFDRLLITLLRASDIKIALGKNYLVPILQSLCTTSKS